MLSTKAKLRLVAWIVSLIIVHTCDNSSVHCWFLWFPFSRFIWIGQGKGIPHDWFTSLLAIACVFVRVVPIIWLWKINPLIYSTMQKQWKSKTSEMIVKLRKCKRSSFLDLIYSRHFTVALTRLWLPRVFYSVLLVWISTSSAIIFLVLSHMACSTLECFGSQRSR